ASTSVDAAGFRWPHAQPSIVLRLWFRASPRLRAESGMCGGDCTIDNFFWLQDLQEPFQRWHEATGGSAVEAHIYSPRDLLEQPDRALVVLALHDLVRMFPELDNTLAEARVWRNPPTHAAFPSGPTNSHHLGVATPWPGVWCCGDWVRHETPAFFLERACVTGLAAANDVLEASGLPVRPLIAHAGPEPLARLLEAGYRGAHRGAVRLREAFSG
ncbi:MAG: hypothetical protein NTZ05_23435, partial [Chloroflexi bacterium]|nr:hypothetical protein [Chloroflexota bacterium]